MTRRGKTIRFFDEHSGKYKLLDIPTIFAVEFPIAYNFCWCLKITCNLILNYYICKLSAAPTLNTVENPELLVTEQLEQVKVSNSLPY
jgi:hypothetical protein